MPFPLPAAPPGTLVAGWGDYGRLLRIAAEAQLRMLVRQPSLGWLTLALIVVLVVEAFWLADLTGSRAPLVVIPSVVVGGGVVFLLGHTAYRVIDPRRLVLLSPTRGSVVDLRFSPDSRIEPSNHTRLRGDASAPALRATIAAWARSSPIARSTFRAQNAKVAALYASHVPELVVGDADVLGRVELIFPGAGPSHDPRPPGSLDT
ncbi:hypothetical protein [Microbacterium sp. NPDC089696]|uniref:hypothetical protein n=1 Tax=Microbacterium sp. NPDC089696 TaxID=3364199 RepID=UPI00381E77E7